jgi:hypothetical protein
MDVMNSTTATTMKSPIQPATIQRSFFTYGSLLMLFATLVTSCSSAPANSSGAASLDPSSPEYQTQMKAAIDKAQECQAKGGNSKECAAGIDAAMKTGANGIEAEAKEKMQQYSACKSQGGSDETCSKQTGVTVSGK